MATRQHGMAARLVMPLAALAAAAALSGCAVYAPPYAYDAAPVVAPYGPAYVAPYDPYYYPYRGYPYAYGRPAWVGPPVALNFGYYHSSRHGGYRGPGWHGGPGWRGHSGGHGPRWGGPRAGGYRGGWGGGARGAHGGGRGGGGRGHR